MKFGITQTFQCAYLPNEQERLIVLVEESNDPKEPYEKLLNAGFRRSGAQIYRPHCINCNACQSLRVPIEYFRLSRSQKRIQTKNRDIKVVINRSDQPTYYQLYRRYINARHTDGSMFPPNKEQYESFLCHDRAEQLFIELWLDNTLVGVAVTDEVSDALSALYTFYAPELEDRSLGTYAILCQIEQAKALGKQYLYLGYQIDDCAKMNYKAKFHPHQRFIDNKWHEFTKKPD
ncbi:arginyltransferase [Neptunicella sp. SCSIO 80796]|uniref:arginyltransferase n=1 Tax=Neptunicella plasticusilytica TaxID=3117012 RepID=UPI003A4E0245